MVMGSTAVKIVIILLAIIGAFVLLSAFGMLFMHGSMMGTYRVPGLLSSIVSICRGMMGG
jgi:hypothetical protein